MVYSNKIKMFKFINIIIIFTLANSLVNKNNIRKYRENINPGKDLVKITHSQASLISKRWLENIIIDISNKNKNDDDDDDKLPSKLFQLQDGHIVSGINQLEKYINNHRSEKDIYLSWMPYSTKPKNIKNKISLFIIVAEFDNENKKLEIKQLVQSPLWNPLQIPSYKLKNALIDYTNQFDSFEIDLNYLYEHDLRYKLSWSVWNLEFKCSDFKD